ncbi:hypothetical protein Lste_0520 [Legionella steelei]|uniref:Uncharacterized protein n=1 Tax=Legionella steelei TaxID=947033 RepID=A0A0W0ZPC2_9GAMM|nr:hypothetical protein Lste_0520 [Legionella steelei]
MMNGTNKSDLDIYAFLTKRELTTTDEKSTIVSSSFNNYRLCTKAIIVFVVANNLFLI